MKVSIERYTEFEKQTDGSWRELHPKTDTLQVEGLLTGVTRYTLGKDILLMTGYTAMDGAISEIVHNKIGNMICLNIQLRGGISSEEVREIFTLPAIIRPPKTVRMVGFAANANKTVEFHITSDGKVSIYRSANSQNDYLYCHGMYYL